jgi:hypothetical protein
MVPSKTNFIEIARQMLPAHIMKYALFGAFQNRIKRLGGVVMRISTGKFLFSMINPIVGCKHFANFTIAMMLIRHQVRSLINPTPDGRQKIGQPITFNRNSPNRAVAFNRNQYSLLLSSPTAFMFNTVFISRLTADIFFVQLNDIVQRGNKLRSRVHHLSDRMTELPRTFLGDADPLGQKYGGYPLA